MRITTKKQAIFHVADSKGLAALAAFTTGFSGAFGVPAWEAAGAVANLPARGSHLPHSVLVRADESGITLFAADRDGHEGRLLTRAGTGQFRASLHRNIGQLQLILTFPGPTTVDLRAKWSPFSRQPMQVARAVIQAARNND